MKSAWKIAACALCASCSSVALHSDESSEGGGGRKERDAGFTAPLDAAKEEAPRHEAGGERPPRRVQRPNIVFVLADDLSWNLVPFMPAVMRLQREGMTFSRYFVTDSLCCPSRSSIFTGKYPHDTHVFTNDGPNGGYGTYLRYGNALESFAVALRAASYETGMMGKYLNGYDPRLHAADPGWAMWEVAGNAYREFDYELNQNGILMHYGRAPGDYLTDVLSSLANDFVESADARPFLLEVATFAPHAPYTPAPRYLGKFHERAPRSPAFAHANRNAPAWLAAQPALTAADIRSIDHGFNRRVEAVQAIDDLIDSLRHALARAGLDDKTYFFFSSDNGYHMGEHMLRAGKQTAFDTDIRVPLVVVGPGIAPGSVDEHVVENVDLCPTFAELAEAATPATAEGRSILPLLDRTLAGDWRRYALVEHRGIDLEPADLAGPDHEPTGAGEPTSYEALRTTSSVYVSYLDGETEYYDHATDPHELTNTAASLTGETARDLARRLDAVKGCHDAASCWEAQK